MTSANTCDRVRNATIAAGFVEPHLRPSFAAFMSVQFVVEIALLGLFVLCFAFFKFVHPHRKQFYRLQVRKLRYVFLVCLGAALDAVTASLFWSRPLDSGVPCFLLLFATANCIAFLALPVLIRLFNFYRSDELTRALVVLPSSNSTLAATSNDREVFSTKQVEPVDMGEDEGASRGAVSSSLSLPHQRQMRKWGWFCFARKGERMEDKLARLHFQQSDLALRVLLVVVLSPFLLSSIVFIGKQEGVGCFGCDLLGDNLYVILVESIIALLSIAYMTWLVRDKQDSFGQLREIRLALFYGGLPAVIMYAVAIATDPIGEFDIMIFVEIFCVVYCYFQSVHQCILAWFEYKANAAAKRQFAMTYAEFEAQVITPAASYHAAFTKHLEMEHSLESIAFLDAVHVFERSFFDATAKTNASRAKRIISMYVGDNAVLPCNLSSRVADQLNQSNNVDFAMFTLAKEEICVMLYRDAFTRFIASPAFQDIYLRNHQQLAPSGPRPTGGMQV